MVDADVKKEEEEEPSFDDPAGFVDDVDEEDLVGDVLRQRPRIEEYEENSIIIFGLPNVGAERLTKLSNVLKKIFDNINPVNKFYIPPNAEGGTRGVVFVEWPDKNMAEFACSVLDGYKLDKNHTFQAILYNRMVDFSKPDDNWVAPVAQPYEDVGDLWSWLQNPRCRDQFAVLYEKHGESTVAVYWNIKGHDPETADHAERKSWTESVFLWSPHGSYLTTLHGQGVAIWAGVDFKRYRRFGHANVTAIDFSPNESYLVTYAPSTGRWGEDDDKSLIIWDVETGAQLKAFSAFALTNREHLPSWPFFSWSHDEKYFACAKPPEKDRLEKEKKVNGISVFETATMELLNKRNVIVENLKTFSWNPSKSILAYYSEGEGDLPAEFGLLAMPAGTKIRAARIYNVAEAQMFWQESGLRLAIHTMRYNKKVTKESGEIKYVGGTTSHIEIFDMSEKDVSQMNIPLKEPFVNFGWEPHGDKLCILSGNSAKCQPLVYRIDPTKHTPVLISKLDAVPQLNCVEWAPAGGWLAVLAQMSTGGNIVFIDTSGTEAKRSNVAEHPGFNKGYWDPTGRYFVSCCTVGGRAGADLGYRIYTFQGRELVRKTLDKMMQFKWRPRPPVKLSEQKIKEIKKNLKTTSGKFDREDNEEKVKASQEVIDKRRKIMGAFDIVRKRNLECIQKQRPTRLQLRDGVDTDDRTVNEEDLVEERITVALSTQKTRTTSENEDDIGED